MRGFVGLKRMLLASVLAVGAFASVAQAATVAELLAQYPDGGSAFESELQALVNADPDGTAQAIAGAWNNATSAQQAAMADAIGDGCQGTGVRGALSGIASFTGAFASPCPDDDQTPPSSFEQTSTGDDAGSGFGGGSISPNTQENPDDEQ